MVVSHRTLLPYDHVEHAIANVTRPYCAICASLRTPPCSRSKVINFLSGELIYLYTLLCGCARRDLECQFTRNFWERWFKIIVERSRFLNYVFFLCKIPRDCIRTNNRRKFNDETLQQQRSMEKQEEWFILRSQASLKFSLTENNSVVIVVFFFQILKFS